MKRTITKTVSKEKFEDQLKIYTGFSMDSKVCHEDSYVYGPPRSANGVFTEYHPCFLEGSSDLGEEEVELERYDFLEICQEFSPASLEYTPKKVVYDEDEGLYEFTFRHPVEVRNKRRKKRTRAVIHGVFLTLVVTSFFLVTLFGFFP